MMGGPLNPCNLSIPVPILPIPPLRSSLPLYPLLLLLASLSFLRLPVRLELLSVNAKSGMKSPLKLGSSYTEE
jgi:hypothetical protein